MPMPGRDGAVAMYTVDDDGIAPRIPELATARVRSDSDEKTLETNEVATHQL